MNSMRKLPAILIWFSCEYHTVKIPWDTHAKLFIQCFIVVSCKYHASFRVIIIQNTVQLNLIILKSSIITFYLNLRIKFHIEKKAVVLVGMLDKELTENNDDDLYRKIFFYSDKRKIQTSFFSFPLTGLLLHQSTKKIYNAVYINLSLFWIAYLFWMHIIIFARYIKTKIIIIWNVTGTMVNVRWSRFDHIHYISVCNIRILQFSLYYLNPCP